MHKLLGDVTGQHYSAWNSDVSPPWVRGWRHDISDFALLQYVSTIVCTCKMWDQHFIFLAFLESLCLRWEQSEMVSQMLGSHGSSLERNGSKNMASSMGVHGQSHCQTILMHSTMVKSWSELQDRNLKLSLTLGLLTYGFLPKNVHSQILPVVSIEIIASYVPSSVVCSKSLIRNPWL